MHLDGFGIFVKDMAVMIRFYRDVLGFEIDEDENAENVYIQKDGTVFMLYRRGDFEKMINAPCRYAEGVNGHYEIALSVDTWADVDRTFQSVMEKGATALMQPATASWGQRVCYIADPEGNIIEIGSFHEE